ncbi:MAG TPA: hexose kinase [Thermoclostridium sp.]|nr:hexose kinase [Thermoclostridium sp.]
MKIITTTLNPAFDLHYRMKDFYLYRENYVDSILVSVGGKGINISHALLKNGIDSISYVILGNENASDFVSLLEADGLDFKAIYTEGKIRENITIHTPGMPETRISQEGFSVTEKITNQLFEKYRQIVDENTVLTFTGRIPKGLSVEYITNNLVELREKNCMLAIDCNSLSMKELIDIRPWLIKPNKDEVEVLLDQRIDTIEEAMDAAVMIQKKGIENVIISMGEHGAAAALNNSRFIAEGLRIDPLSTIGAGDSMIAGFIGAYIRQSSLKECFANAVAYGTAACLTEGTAPPREEDIENIKNKIIITQPD